MILDILHLANIIFPKGKNPNHLSACMRRFFMTETSELKVRSALKPAARRSLGMTGAIPYFSMSGSRGFAVRQEVSKSGQS